MESIKLKIAKQFVDDFADRGIEILGPLNFDSHATVILNDKYGNHTLSTLWFDLYDDAMLVSVSCGVLPSHFDYFDPSSIARIWRIANEWVTGVENKKHSNT